jgi:hypothetical protein
MFYFARELKTKGSRGSGVEGERGLNRPIVLEATKYFGNDWISFRIELQKIISTQFSII